MSAHGTSITDGRPFVVPADTPRTVVARTAPRRTPETSQNTFDREWQAKVNVLPYPTDRVEIFDGRVEYRDDTTQPPTSLVIADLDLRADNVGRAKAQGGRRGATLGGTAKVMGLSALTLDYRVRRSVLRDLPAALLSAARHAQR